MKRDRFEMSDQSMTARALISEARNAAGRGWLNMLAEAEGAASPIQVSDGVAEITMYGPIDPWFGIDAWELAPAIRAVDAEQINVRLDSGGGYIMDGVLLYNALADHDASVTVTVDGAAGSAASFLAMAADRLVMNRGSEMMIHKALVGMVGNSDDLRAVADDLDRQNLKIAEMYAARAGGDVADWIEAMAIETRYSADEAVAAGLADEAVPMKAKTAAKAKNEDLGRSDGSKNVIGDDAPEVTGGAATAADPITRQRALAMANAATALAIR